jgi:hypothetical protein
MTSLFSVLNKGLQTVKPFVYLLALIFVYCRYKLPLRSQMRRYEANTTSNRSRCQSEVCITTQASNFFEILDADLLALDVKSVPLKQVNES